MPASAGVARCQLSPGSGQDLAANAGATPVPRAQAVATAAVAMIRLERTASSRRAGYPSGLEQPPLHRPRRQLVTAGELELSKGQPGENTASPSRTRCTASARSGPEIVLVT